MKRLAILIVLVLATGATLTCAAHADSVSDMQATVSDLQSRISGIQSAIDSATTRWSAQVADATACRARVSANDPNTDPMTCDSLDQQAAMTKQSIDMQQQTVTGYAFQITQLQNSIYNIQHPEEAPRPVATSTPTPTPIPTPTQSISSQSQSCIDLMNSWMEQVNSIRISLSQMRTFFLEPAVVQASFKAKGINTPSEIASYYQTGAFDGLQSAISTLQKQYTAGSLADACQGAAQWQSFDNSAKSEIMTRLPEDYNTTVKALNSAVARMSSGSAGNSSSTNASPSATTLLIAPKPIPTISVAPSVAPVYNKPIPAPKASTTIKAKPTTIVCFKGKKSVKVTAVKPACPKGYTKK